MKAGISIYIGLDNTLEENLQLIKDAADWRIKSIFTSFHIPETDTAKFKAEAQATLKSAGALVENGVQNVLNGKLSNFMSTHRNPSIAETRQAALASKRKEASSVVCGRIEDIGIDKVDGGFMAKVEVTLQWIGLENNYADPYSEYFTYVSPNMDIAVREARKKAANEAALVLCQRALKTMQFENQGGQKHIVTELHIYGMSPAYEMQLMNLLEGMNCDFDDDYGFDPNGVFKVSFEVTGYKNVGDFRRKLAIAAQGIGMNLSNLKSDATDFDPMIQLRVI